MENIQVDKNLMDKIRKLMDKAQSSEELGNLNEAEAFAAKVSELLTKHNLSRFDIKEKSVKNGIIDKEFKDITPVKNEGLWIFDLYHTISKFYYCSIIVNTRMILTSTHQAVSNKHATLFGTEENIEVVRFMGEQLESKIRFYGKRDWKRYHIILKQKKNTFLREYYKGAVVGLFVKLERQRNDQIQDNSNITDLVVCNKEALVKAIDDKYGKVRNEKRKRSRPNAGRSLGIKKGSELELNKGVGGHSAENKLAN